MHHPHLECKNPKKNMFKKRISLLYIMEREKKTSHPKFLGFKLVIHIKLASLHNFNFYTNFVKNILVIILP
jgi:hypothetical protein